MTDTELKLCQVCGKPAQKAAYDSRYAYCPNSECGNHAHLPITVWNTRLIEDALQARVAELEAAIIVTDTNGQSCLICGGQDDDYEDVIHKSDCPMCKWKVRDDRS